MHKKSSVGVLANALPSGKTSVSDYRSVSIRQVDNGYIRTESRDGPDGYSCSETIHRTKPGFGEMGERPQGASSLREAVNSMKGK